MLCDDLMDLRENVYGGLEYPTTVRQYLFEPIKEIQSKLGLAEKFILSDDFACAAQSPCLDKPSSIVKAIDYARAPFQRVWLEWSGAPYKGYAGGEQFRSKPNRVGVLIESREDFTSGVLTLAWKIRSDGETELRVSSIKMEFSTLSDINNNITCLNKDYLRRIEGDAPWASAALKSAEELDAMEFFEGCFAPVVTQESVQKAICTDDRIYDLLAKDWQGECPFVFSCLILMNVKNGAKPTKSDLSTLNKRRIKDGRRPLFEYKTLTIRREEHTTPGFGAGARSANRAHLVRGHFKKRKNGVFWWTPFRRGNETVGSIEKRYRVA